MNAGMGAWLAAVPWAGFLGLVLETSLKAAAVCAFAGAAVLLMRRSSAHARSMVWVFTLAVLLVLPLAQLVSPLWNIPVIPAVESWFAWGAETGAPVMLSDKALDAQDALGAAANGSAAVYIHDTIVKKGPETGIKAAMALKESGDANYVRAERGKRQRQEDAYQDRGARENGRTDHHEQIGLSGRDSSEPNVPALRTNRCHFQIKGRTTCTLAAPAASA